MIIIPKAYKHLNHWSEIPYPDERVVYHGLDNNAGSWPLNYIIRKDYSTFETLNGEPIAWQIINPCNVDFEKELEEVYEVKENLTQWQIDSAIYWGTGVPLQQLGPIALKLFESYKITPAKSARIMSALINTINDAFVITWYFKYLWDYPRPVQLDRHFETVIPTPIFPTYPSGHSVVSGAAIEVLCYYFPMESYKLRELANEASMSRLYAGVHFRSDLEEGIRLGQQIGNIAVDYLKTQSDKDGILVDFVSKNFEDADIYPDYCCFD